MDSKLLGSGTLDSGTLGLGTVAGAGLEDTWDAFLVALLTSTSITTGMASDFELAATFTGAAHLCGLCFGDG